MIRLRGCFLRMAVDDGRVQRWRDRALELRQAAEGIVDDDARAGVLGAAKSYERMANELEGRLSPPDRD